MSSPVVQLNGTNSIEFVGAASSNVDDGVASVVLGSTTAVYYGDDEAAADAGNNTITLGSVPIAGSALVFQNGLIVLKSLLTVVGAVITTSAPFAGADAITVTWATLNAVPGGIVLSTV